MAYYDISLLAGDVDFLNRANACATVEGIDEPLQWVSSHQWDLAATPGFGDKYGYAVNTGVQNPGRDEAVISDGDILSAVQALNATP